eukprot:370359-Amorphochlora_amoeboformis.AAC.1
MKTRNTATETLLQGGVRGRYASVPGFGAAPPRRGGPPMRQFAAPRPSPMEQARFEECYTFTS